MVVLEVGRVCLKLAGREAGSYCVVVKPAGKSKDEKSFVLVTGPKLLTGVKRRRANIEHLQATEYKLEMAEDAADDAVVTAYEKAGLITKFGLKKPSAAQLKAKEEKAKEKEQRAKELAKGQAKSEKEKAKEKEKKK